MFLWLTTTKYMFSFMIICIYTWRHEITRKVAYENETCDNKQMLQMFQSNVSTVNACLWMRADHAHVMQVKLCKANTRGVTPCPQGRTWWGSHQRGRAWWDSRPRGRVRRSLCPWGWVTWIPYPWGRARLRYALDHLRELAFMVISFLLLGIPDTNTRQ